MSGKTALIVLCEGFEEIEALAPVDLLRRAEVECTVASCEPTPMVRGRSGVRVEADAVIDEIADRLFDCIIVPGGPGTAALRRDSRVLALLRAHRAQDRLVGAICAAPTVLLDAGLLPGPRYTGHASIASELPELETQAVVIDGGLVTSRGAGTAIAFGLALVGKLVGPDQRDQIAKSIHFSEGGG